MNPKEKRKYLEKRSSPQTLRRAKKSRVILEGCSPPCGPSGLAQGHRQTEGESECIPMDKLIHKEFHKSQEDGPKKRVTVPAWDPSAGEDSSSSVYFCGVSTSREDGAKKLIVVPSCSLDEGESSSASVRFCGVLKSAEDAPRKPVMVPSRSLDAGESSSASVCFCGVLKSADDAARKPVMVPSRSLDTGESSSASVRFCGVLKSAEDAPRKPVMVPSRSLDTGESSSASVCFCGILKSADDAARKPVVVPSWNPDAGESSSASVYFCGVSKSREDPPKKSVTVPLWNPAASENSSASVYFCGISSGNKITPVEKDESHKLRPGAPFRESHGMPLKDLTGPESSLPFPLDYIAAYFDNHPCTSSAPTEWDRVMKVYYMRVQMKRGVAVLPDTEGLMPPQKKMRIEEIMFPEKAHTEAYRSYVPTIALLDDSEFSLDHEAQEEKEEVHSPPEPVVCKESSRARTPEWLVALDRGYRCMACCRVFPNLETLRYHVEHGIKEGFSCHAFHEAFACLMDKKKKKQKRRKMKTFLKKDRLRKEKLCDMRASI